MPFPVIVLGVVFGLIAVRRVGRVRMRIWQVMVAGALAVLVHGDIPLRAALAAIEPDVMVFLFGMFVLGHAAVASGVLYRLAYGAFAPLRSAGGLVAGVLVASAAASALLMNDTLAIVGAPLALRLAREHGLDARLLLLALCFGVTLGGVASPIGNPQNLLIAVSGGVPHPFVNFALWLGPPTLASLGVAWLVLRIRYARDFHATPLIHTPVRLRDPRLARRVHLGLGLVLALVAIKVGLVAAGTRHDLPFAVIALAGAAPVLAHPRRVEMLRGIDWSTLAFFVGLFVLMAAVWRSGFLQDALAASGLDLAQVPVVMTLSLLVSQFVSNVPLVALSLPLVGHAGAGLPGLMALAAGSTLAGNLLILGAASNVIVVQRGERAGVHLSFAEFARVGVPLTVVTATIHAAWLVVMARWAMAVAG